MGLHTTALAGTVALMPLQVEAPMSEVLEWMSEVKTSRNGSEERRRLRKNPRQRLTADFPARFAQAARALNVAYGGLGRTWAAPLWQDAQMVGAVSSGATQVLCEPANVDLRDDSLALLWQGPDDYALVEIDAVLSDRITLLSATTRAFTSAALLPLRLGRVTSDIQRETTGLDSGFRFVFEVKDNTDLVPADPAQFLGDDIYFEPHLFSGGSSQLTETLETLQEQVDFEVGLVDTYAPWDNPRVGRSYFAVAEDRAASWALRQWLHRRAGRHKAFWTPTFECDLRPVGSGPVGSVLTVSDQDFATFGRARLHIAIEDRDGNWYPRTVDSYSTGVGTVLLNLDTDVGINVEDIRRISYLGLKRLDADRIELRWVGNNVCQTSLRIMELTP